MLEVEEEGNAPMYYVHYLGWNTRYDEWIRRPRIAENITWSQNRARKGRAAATKELKEKKEKEKDLKKEDKEPVRICLTFHFFCHHCYFFLSLLPISLFFVDGM